ncbi:Glutathione S-transferase S1 [Entomortierella chlamydospora]|uniref:Glutathione S-transferase S1 n=1 Tax=Entomortierella chlamydospora TaxID=101097 RepID=A0A9P6MVJ2_9FUNG|nr:Glutathione S-transferase S1 [Entomortierella chlamydospora]
MSSPSRETASTFELTYFDLQGFGAPIRTIFAINGTKVTNIVPADWAAEKPLTPFGVMPLLKETSVDGKSTIHLAESDAIDRYLVKKFGMAGDNVFEENIINSYVSNTNSLQLRIFMKYYTVRDPALKTAFVEDILGYIDIWIKSNERQLVANGSNGHYVGNKLTIADVKAAYMVDLIRSLKEDAITEESTPALLKVKTTVDSIPSLVAWRATEEHEAYSEHNFSLFGYK